MPPSFCRVITMLLGGLLPCYHARVYNGYEQSKRAGLPLRSVHHA
jgi:hypothetical protein